MTRQLHLGGFQIASQVTHSHAAWRHPASDTRFTTPDYYHRIGRILERGKFDCVFFDDRLAMPGVYGNSVADAVRYGARPIKLDLTAVLGGIIGATDRIIAIASAASSWSELR